MHDDAAAKRSLSVWFSGISFAEIAMASFKKVHEMFCQCLCLIKEIIDEEEFGLLHEAYRPINLPFPHSTYEKFSLANKDSAESKADFRVEKRDICRNGTIFDGNEGLCIG